VVRQAVRQAAGQHAIPVTAPVPVVVVFIAG
jgi:hypothetical protein